MSTKGSISAGIHDVSKDRRLILHSEAYEKCCPVVGVLSLTSELSGMFLMVARNQMPGGGGV